MKRTVKAWVVVESVCRAIEGVFVTRERARAFIRAGEDSSLPVERVIPGQLTYDDGRKSPPRKRRGGSR